MPCRKPIGSGDAKRASRGGAALPVSSQTREGFCVNAGSLRTPWSCGRSGKPERNYGSVPPHLQPQWFK